MKIGFIPIDDRPVCYLLPKLISEIDEDIELFLPERNLLGNLVKPANVEAIFDWLRKLPELDAIILSLDTVAYGGLISSRRCSDSFEEIYNRIETLKNILETKQAKIYAFSSIMRISNNNINEEEKEYWNIWGKKIFEYSFNQSKNGVSDTDVPEEILKDYLDTRNRNFEINKVYLKWQKENFFETLIFSKDDCAEYGLNVDEANELQNLGGFIKTGADEIPLSLFSCAIKGEIKIAPVFLEPEYVDLISNYEDISIQKSVFSQLELAGCKIVNENEADILLYVNNFVEKQGEIVMKVPTKNFDKKWVSPSKPYMIADVRFANGADNAFVEELFETDFDEKFYGYSAWNTSANSLGSLICVAKTRYLAKKYNEKAFKKLQIVRFLDDWAYQANVRQTCGKEILSDMKKWESIVCKKFDLYPKIMYKLPWNRMFEVEIEFI